jgi:hypothetical protein
MRKNPALNRERGFCFGTPGLAVSVETLADAGSYGDFWCPGNDRHFISY